LTRFRILAVFVALIALTSTLAACGSGGSEDPQTVVDEATLQGVESANLDLALGVDVKGKEGGHLDASLSGPFQRESEAELPEFDLSASAKGRLGDEDVDFEGGFTLLGDKAYVGYEGTEYEVDPATFNFVRSLVKRKTGAKNPSSEVTACQEAASELKLSNLMTNLKSGGSADVDGTSTTKVSGDLDIGGAIDAAIELSEDPACSAQLNAAGSLPSKTQLEKRRGELESAVKAAHVDLYVGDDHIVRRVVARVTIEPEKGKGSEKVKSVEIEFDLKLSGVNEEQAIEAPASSKPLSALFVKLGINPLELLGLLQGGAGGLNGQGGLNSLLERIGSGGIQ
jgi:hypothetical protein